LPGLTFVSFCLKRNGFASFATKRRIKISFTDRCKQFYDLSSNYLLMNYPAASCGVSVQNSIYEFDATLSPHPQRARMPCPYAWHQQQTTPQQSFEEFFSIKPEEINN